jgi:hypothetical protein
LDAIAGRTIIPFTAGFQTARQPEDTAEAMLR